MIAQLFGKTFQLLEKALDLRSERHRVIVSNIANQDTPGYKATQIDFKEALTNSSGGSASVALATTNPSHLPSGGFAPTAAEPVPVSPSDNGGARLDGNTVNAEQEMAKLADNSLMYQATVQFISGQFTKLLTAIREGR
ncbi:MAG TPA: flagellar basal body rod protein FlgB [Nitrospiria bacterium]|nr:flagellar basal body rod protein FlgB [Nitrospiria bacterium]